MQVDIDIKVEGMCDKCKSDMEKDKCTRCGEEIKGEATSKNKGFDENKFKALAGDIDV